MNGVWEGTYQRFDAKEVEQITMTIKQTWTSVVIRTTTKYADSVSHTASIIPITHANSHNTFFELIFTWSGEAKDISDSGFTGLGGLWGTTILMLDTDTPNILEGHYYTNLQPTQTRGNMRLQSSLN